MTYVLPTPPKRQAAEVLTYGGAIRGLPEFSLVS
jgi:hypothetical protein